MIEGKVDFDDLKCLALFSDLIIKLKLKFNYEIERKKRNANNYLTLECLIAS